MNNCVLIIAVTFVQLVFLPLSYESQCTPKSSASSDSSFTKHGVCVFQDNLEGAVFLRQGASGTEFRVKVKNLEEGRHGFHVHEFGSIFQSDSTAGRCKAAGGHYNPLGKDHGAPGDPTRHVGDLGNICADKNGEVNDVFVDTRALLDGSEPIVGYAIVIHENMDDGSTQPTGNAGGRVGCCVIGYSDVWDAADVSFGYLTISNAFSNNLSTVLLFSMSLLWQFLA